MKMIFRVLVVLFAFMALPVAGCSNSDGTSTAPEGEGKMSTDTTAIQDAATIKDEAPKGATPATPAK